MNQKPAVPGTLLHVYDSIGPSMYGTICGLYSDETPSIHAVSIDTGARCAATGFLGTYAIYTVCEECFSDQRVALKTLAAI